MPLDACSAQSRGSIGYVIQQTLENALHEAGLAYSPTPRSTSRQNR